MPPPSSQSPTNNVVVDIDLTKAGPSSIHISISQLTNCVKDLMVPGPSSIHGHKRQLEEEEDQVPEQFQPLVFSTPNVSCYLLL